MEREKRILLETENERERERERERGCWRQKGSEAGRRGRERGT